jgi:DNA-nicking Smr family endonuclease
MKRRRLPPTPAFDLEDEGSELRGRRNGLDPRQLRKLRGGGSRPEAQLDLHGTRADEARRLLGQFLARERARGHRVVLVICGRGLHSPGGQGVLRAEIGRWLSSGAASAHVLGFTSARPEDGGDGAIYVLLRGT